MTLVARGKMDGLAGIGEFALDEINHRTER